jgi:hypothetical protein
VTGVQTCALPISEPDQICDIYDSGFAGVLRDDAWSNYAQSACGGFYGGFDGVAGVGAGKLSMPIRAIMTMAGEDFFAKREEAQRQGDCVGKNVRNAGMTDYCSDAYFGETEFLGPLAEENIYGDRGHAGQGANCGRLAMNVSPNGRGGFLVRRKYEDTGGQVADLSSYNPRLSSSWGWRGTPEWLQKIASQNKAMRVWKCESLEEARDANYLGYGLVRCGWQGYSRKRDSHGVSPVTTRWAHAFLIAGCDDTEFAHSNYGGMLFLAAHNWGMWNDGPKRHDQPDGSWWIRGQELKANITAGGVYVVASVRGYNRQLVMDRASRLEELYCA